MAHNITKIDKHVGLVMGWHGLTEVVEKIVLAGSGHDHEILEKPISFTDGGNIPGFRALVCSDNDHVLAIAKDSYKVVQNSRMWELLVNSMPQGSVFESVLTCGGRSKYAVTVDIGGVKSKFDLADREFNNRIVAAWSHDGTMGLTLFDCNTCVVCQNTLNVSLAENHNVSFYLKHTENVDKRLDKVEEALIEMQSGRELFYAKLGELAETKCDAGAARNLFAGFMTDGEKRQLSTRASNTVDRMGELFVRGAGNRGETMLDCFSAITDFYSHESSGGENRLKQLASSEFGAGANAKARAWRGLTNVDTRKAWEVVGAESLALAS